MGPAGRQTPRVCLPGASHRFRPHGQRNSRYVNCPNRNRLSQHVWPHCQAGCCGARRCRTHSRCGSASLDHRGGAVSLGRLSIGGGHHLRLAHLHGQRVGSIQDFQEATSNAVLAKGAWKDKVAAGFTNSGAHAGDKLATLIQIALFAAQHGMHWVNLALPPANNSTTGSDQDLNRLGFWLGAGAQSMSIRRPRLCRRNRIWRRLAIWVSAWQRLPCSLRAGGLEERHVFNEMVITQFDRGLGRGLIENGSLLRGGIQ